MKSFVGGRHAWVLAAAIGIGACAGSAVVLLASQQGEGVDAVTDAADRTTTSSAPQPEWFHPSEVLLGPSILVPESMRVETDALSLRYRLEPITPSAVGPDVAVDTAVLPDRWTLVTPVGDVAASTEPWTRVVSFSLPAGTMLDDVTLRLDRYWARSPFHASVTLDPAGDPTAEIAPGVSLELVRMIPGSAGSQVVVGLYAGEGFAVSDLTVEGTGGAWQTSSIDQTGTGFWTLSFTTPEPPIPLVLVVRGVLWVPIDTDLLVDLDEVPRD